MKKRCMVIDLCSALVGSDKRFKNKDTDGEYRPYKNYRDLYPPVRLLPMTSQLKPPCIGNGYLLITVKRLLKNFL